MTTHPHSPRTNARLTKLLINVTVQGSIGPIQLVMSPENTVGELTKAVLEVYSREKRKPFLMTTSCFQLHYSPFSLECLDEDEQLINLGSRNFFMCSKPNNNSNMESCSKPNNTKSRKFTFPLVEMLMDILP